MTPFPCPDCGGQGWLYSSGDGWSECDDCHMCGTTGRTNADAVTAMRADDEALDYAIRDLMARDDERIAETLDAWRSGALVAEWAAA